MTNEIKEILNEMKKICDVWVKVDGNMKAYNQDQIHCIYDYITNLQEENENLKEQLENDIDRYEDAISYQFGFDKGKEYIQQRIDKATNYILENICCNTRVYTKSENVYKVVDILRGDE